MCSDVMEVDATCIGAGYTWCCAEDAAGPCSMLAAAGCGKLGQGLAAWPRLEQCCTSCMSLPDEPAEYMLLAKCLCCPARCCTHIPRSKHHSVVLRAGPQAASTL